MARCDTPRIVPTLNADGSLHSGSHPWSVFFENKRGEWVQFADYTSEANAQRGIEKCRAAICAGRR